MRELIGARQGKKLRVGRPDETVGGVSREEKLVDDE